MGKKKLEPSAVAAVSQANGIIFLMSVIAVLSSSPATAVSNLTVISFFGHGNLSQKYIKEVELPGELSSSESEIIYGNDSYGYFRATEINRGEGNVKLKILPPGYRTPLTFFARSSAGGLRELGTKAFVSPTPPMFDSGKDLPVGSGSKLSTPFVLLSGSIPLSGVPPEDDYEEGSPNKWRLSYSYAVNRQGEIVWLHLPANGERMFADRVTAKPVAGGKHIAYMTCAEIPFGSLTVKTLKDHKENCLFAIVDRSGKLLRQLYSATAHLPKKNFRGDFIIRPETHSLYTTGSADHFLYDPQNLLAQPRKFSATNLQFIDYSSSRGYPLFDFVKTVPFHRLASHKQKNNLFAVSALDYDTGSDRILVNLRNQNRIALLTGDGQSIVATMGSGKRDHINVTNPDAQFKRQGFAGFGKDGRTILVLSKAKIIRFNLKPNLTAIDAVQVIPVTGATSGRGSVAELKQGHLLGFFPRTKVKTSDTGTNRKTPLHLLLEFDRQGKEIARLALPADQFGGGGLRAYPLRRIGADKFVGFKQEDLGFIVSAH